MRDGPPDGDGFVVKRDLEAEGLNGVGEDLRPGAAATPVHEGVLVSGSLGARRKTASVEACPSTGSLAPYLNLRPPF